MPFSLNPFSARSSEQVAAWMWKQADWRYLRRLISSVLIFFFLVCLFLASIQESSANPDGIMASCKINKTSHIPFSQPVGFFSLPPLMSSVFFVICPFNKTLMLQEVYIFLASGKRRVLVIEYIQNIELQSSDIFLVVIHKWQKAVFNESHAGRLGVPQSLVCLCYSTGENHYPDAQL